jgi:uncharacterized ferritin-like protein (DUF455 family)
VDKKNWEVLSNPDVPKLVYVTPPSRTSANSFDLTFSYEYTFFIIYHILFNAFNLKDASYLD